MSELSRWLTWKESQTFERKSCYNKDKTPPERLNARVVSEFIAETLSAMANADGGVLLVGQENLREDGEDGGGDITGVDYRVPLSVARLPMR
jgi:predicted HTH transcriptional regulator